MEDSGALPLEMDVSALDMGRVIDIYPTEGVVKDHETGEVSLEPNLSVYLRKSPPSA